MDQAIEGISTYQNFSFSSSIPKEIGFELDLTKGTNKGEITLNLVGSYYGSPDEFSEIVKPFLDAMVRAGHGATQLADLNPDHILAQSDVACTSQCNFVAGKLGPSCRRPNRKYARERRYGEQYVLCKEPHNAVGSAYVTGSHHCSGELDVSRGVVY